jgi:hypothetical protein
MRAGAAVLRLQRRLVAQPFQGHGADADSLRQSMPERSSDRADTGLVQTLRLLAPHVSDPLR